MGTRARVDFIDEVGDGIASLYVHWDGYPSGFGRELCLFLEGKKVYAERFTAGVAEGFNGMDCLAAAVIAHFKRDVGMYYLSAFGRPTKLIDWVYLVMWAEDGYPQVVIEDVKTGRQAVALAGGKVVDWVVLTEEYWDEVRRRILGGGQ